MDGPRVLLVDDEAELVMTMAERLTLRGFRVDAVTSGREAVALIAERTYDAAVVDLKMPGVGGLAVLEAARRDRPSMPVILLTGHGSTEEGEEGVKNGAFAYVFKPTSLETLIETIARATGRSS